MLRCVMQLREASMTAGEWRRVATPIGTGTADVKGRSTRQSAIWGTTGAGCWTPEEQCHGANDDARAARLASRPEVIGPEDAA
ncbi:unnamed protein product, partial [Pleuronectes platessa]